MELPPLVCSAGERTPMACNHAQRCGYGHFRCPLPSVPDVYAAGALVRRKFREGPKEVLGTARALRLASTLGNTFGLLIDGEQAEAPSEIEFVLAAAEVDLVATEADGQ